MGGSGGWREEGRRLLSMWFERDVFLWVKGKLTDVFYCRYPDFLLGNQEVTGVKSGKKAKL